MSTKKVFLTTLSTIPGVLPGNISYHQANIEGNERYYTGFSTNEPGAKYMLTTKQIDKLVIIGSDQTVHEKDPLKTTIADINYRNFQIKDSSPYMFLLYRLSQFLDYEDIEAGEILHSVPPHRQEELKKLVTEIMTDAGHADSTSWFEVLSTNSKLQSKLQEKLLKDIKKDYVPDKDANQDLEKKDTVAFPELKALEAGEVSTEEMIRQLKALEDEAFSTFLDRELFLVMGLRSIDNRIATLEKERLEKRNEALTAIIEKLRSLNMQLWEELRDIKRHRIEVESMFVKHYIFNELEEEKKLSPDTSGLFKPSREHTEPVEFVPLMRGEVDNIAGIVSAIFDDSVCPEAQKIELFVDVQGGSRTDAFIRNQILSVLENETDSRIVIRQIISSDFQRKNYINRMQDETARYQINKLVSGMNAFVNYGKAGLLKEYISAQGYEQDEALSPLVDAMLNIDTAIALCDIQGFEDGIGTLRNAVSVSPKTGNQASEYFSVLRDGIRRSYGKLVTEEKISPPDLIRWCSERQMIQQALTLYTEKIPVYYFESGLFDGFVNLDDVKAKPGNSKESLGLYNNVYDQLANRNYFLLKKKYADRIFALQKEMEDLPDDDQKKQRTLDLISQGFLSDQDSIIIKAGDRLIDIINSCYNDTGHRETALVKGYGEEEIKIDQKVIKGFLNVSAQGGALEHYILVDNAEQYAVYESTHTYTKKMTAVNELLEDESSPYKRDLAIVLAYYLCVKVLRNRMNHAGDKEQEDVKEIREILSELAIPGSNGKLYRFAVKESIGDIQTLLSDAVEASQLLVSHAPEVSKMLVSM